MAIVRAKLSASTNGQAVALATAAPTTIHTSTTAASTSDEVHIWVSNTNASTATAYIWMGATTSGNMIAMDIPSMTGLYLMAPGLFLASGLIAYGSAGATGILAFGFVNRLTTGV